MTHEVEDDQDEDEDEPVRDTDPSMYPLGAVLYIVGALLAFCGLPQFDGVFLWPLRGWAGVLGAMLLAVSPRSGVLRSFGLMGLWTSGLFLGKNPIIFLFGSTMLITGIALAHYRPVVFELPPDEESNEPGPRPAEDGGPS
jgi:hypothetical protein